MIRVTRNLVIPEQELRFTTCRATGPGGQHVNTTDSCVTLYFDVENSPSLDNSQRERIRTKLAGRMSKEGVLRIVGREHKSQSRNKDAAIERFRTLLADALKVQKKRRPSKPSRAAKARRMDAKKKRGELKKLRKMDW